MDYDYFDFDFSSLPELFEHEFAGENFELRLYYNAVSDAFYIDIKDDSGVKIIDGEKLVYYEPLWAMINDQRLPVIVLSPLDPDGEESTVTALNFPTKVRLSFSGIAEDSDEINDLSELNLDDDDTVFDNNDEDEQSDDDLNLYGNDPTIDRGL